jgi:hypothetical protein
VYALTAAIGSSFLAVGGDFPTAAGVLVNNIVLWLGFGFSALAVNSSIGTDGAVHSLAVVGSDLYFGGQFSRLGFVKVNRIARWTGSGRFGDSSGFAALPMGPSVGVTGFQVSALITLGTDLYLGGAFPHAGPIRVNNIVRWAGSQFHPLPTGTSVGVNGAVQVFAEMDGDLYLGGQFSMAGSIKVNHIARWNGTAATALQMDSVVGVNGFVYALAVMDSDLYVRGGFVSAGSVTANYIARWTGNEFVPLQVGTQFGVSGSVLAVAVIETDLYVAGDFTKAAGSPGMIDVNYIARWSGSVFAPLIMDERVGMDGPVYALAVKDSAELYMAGQFIQAGSVTARHIAEWDGSQFNALVNGLLPPGTSDTVRLLVVMGQDLYLAGDFIVAGVAIVKRVARWMGSDFSAVEIGPNVGIQGAIYSLATADTKLYMGGEFFTTGGKVVNNVIVYSKLAPSLPSPAASTSPSVAPSVVPVSLRLCDVQGLNKTLPVMQTWTSCSRPILSHSVSDTFDANLTCVFSAPGDIPSLPIDLHQRIIQSRNVFAMPADGSYLPGDACFLSCENASTMEWGPTVLLCDFDGTWIPAASTNVESNHQEPICDATAPYAVCLRSVAYAPKIQSLVGCGQQAVIAF